MMDCSACGTPLPQGAANCPRCGAATPSYYSPAGPAPNDPTVVSFPDAVAAPPPPPTLYGSPPYQSPYEPYHVAPLAPPLPLPQRPGKRIGLIIGVVLLVLLLLGGGVGAWLAYSAARNAAATAAVATTTAHTNATATASANFTANGTFTNLNTTTTSVTQDGQNTIYNQTVQGVFNGDMMGSYSFEYTDTLHPDKTSTFSGHLTCTCTVAGKSGTLQESINATGAADGSFQGQFFDLQGTGDLANLHGQGTFHGQGSHGTYSEQLHFDG